MATVRLALANLPFPDSPEASVAGAEAAIADAAAQAALVVCFPECAVPGYRASRTDIDAPSQGFLESAWQRVAAAAKSAGVTVVLGTERIVNGRHRISTLVVNADGSVAGLQDKVQLDPSEEVLWEAGAGRQVFTAGPLTFGVAICHEGWRYPETVRWAARHGAQVVFLPHFHEATPGSYRPTTFADPANTFHEKAMLCRAAENACWIAAVNFAGEGSPSTSAVVRPDGTLLTFQPYGVAGLLVADVDLAEATGLLALRLRPC